MKKHYALGKMILSENKFAVLLDENYFSEFEEQINQDSSIETVFIVTDYEAKIPVCNAKIFITPGSALEVKNTSKPVKIIFLGLTE